MKRDMDLVRKILLYLEENADPHDWIFDLKIGDYSDKEISYHIKIMAQEGLIEASERPRSDLDYDQWIPHSLTWAGHEFLDASRDDSRWEKVKRLVADKTGSLSFEVLKAGLVQAMLQTLK